MKWGAFVLLDCLGFKGIWRRHEPLSVVARFAEIKKQVRRKVARSAKDLQFSHGPLKTQISLISDTIAISIQFTENRELSKHDRLLLVALAVSATEEVCRLFHEGTPALLLRGCITCGLHLIDGTTILGPAVDEAAENMSDADGPFIWLQPEAEDAFYRFLVRTLIRSKDWQVDSIEIRSMLEQRLPRKLVNMPLDVPLTVVLEVGFDMLVRSTMFYDVPTNDGSRVRRMVLNPCVHAKYRNEIDAFVDRWLKTMPEGNRELAGKRRNTIEFFKSLEESLGHFRKGILDDMERLEEAGLAPWTKGSHETAT